MAAETNGPPQEALPNDPLSNFTLPFPSPDPSAISQLWNAAQPFLSCEHADGILHEPTHEVPGASDYLNAVGSSVGSLDLVFKRLGMGGRSIGERGEEAWNVLLPQVMDVIGAVSNASALCKEEPHKITTSGIIPTLLRLIETTMTISSPPDTNPKRNRATILDIAKSKRSKITTSHILTPFHAEFLQCCILSQHYRFAQQFLYSHPVHTHVLLLSSNNALSSKTPDYPRFNIESYLRFHYYSGFIHMECHDWNSALSSLQLCLTVPCTGSTLNEVASIIIAARKKMLLIRCLLLEAEEMDGSTGSLLDVEQRRGSGGTPKSKKSVIENKVLEVPGAASQAVCRYLSNPTKRVGDNSGERSQSAAHGSIPERAGERGSETGDDRIEEYHTIYGTNHRHQPSISDGTVPNDRGSTISSVQMKHIRQLGQYHDLVSTFIAGISSHYATLLVEMHDLLVTDGNWALAKRLEERLVYRVVREMASTYSMIGIVSLEDIVRDSCGASVQKLTGSSYKIEDALAGMAACDWEDAIVSDPLYARIDQNTALVNFVESDTEAMANEEAEEQWLEYDLSKRMELCVGLAEHVRDLDIQLTTSTKYQQQVAKWELRGDMSMKLGQGVADVGHSTMDVAGDW